MFSNIVSCIDLTSLNTSDTTENISALCKKAVTPMGQVAAVCIYPQFVTLARQLLQKTSVKIATVANFPGGDEVSESVFANIQMSINNGAQEIDVVFPYKSYLSGDEKSPVEFIKKCKSICGEQVVLKVILETGALPDEHVIAEISRKALQAGADFLKTSTGKIAVGATPEAVRVMLLVIKSMSQECHRAFGLKVSGGVRTVEHALQYIQLASDIMGVDWVTPKTFRIGASGLLDDILRRDNRQYYPALR